MRARCIPPEMRWAANPPVEVRRGLRSGSQMTKRELSASRWRWGSGGESWRALCSPVERSSHGMLRRMPRERSRHRASPALHTPRIDDRPQLWITASLLLLLPIVFVRTLPDVFEFPKLELIATGALLLLALGAARESARIRAAGGAAWLAALPRRLTAWALADPLGASIAAYLASALASTLISARPALSIFGAPER